MADDARPSSLRWVRYGLWALVALALAAVAWAKYWPQADTALRDVIGRGDYRLQATDGSEFTQASLVGAPSVVFFGFTHCPEVCPTTLADLSVWQDELGEAGKDLRIFFVTVDPERDSVETLADYVGWLPGAVGVGGAPDEVKKAEQAFHIYARKVPLDDGGYSMDHSAYLMMFDANGRFVEPIGYGEDYDRAIAKLKRLVGA